MLTLTHRLGIWPGPENEVRAEPLGLSFGLEGGLWCEGCKNLVAGNLVRDWATKASKRLVTRILGLVWNPCLVPQAYM